MIAQFLHYYPGYTVDSVLEMRAVTFYTLLSAMHRLQGVEDLNHAFMHASVQSGGKSFTKYIDDAKKRARGLSGILEEVRKLKNVNKRR